MRLRPPRWFWTAVAPAMVRSPRFEPLLRHFLSWIGFQYVEIALPIRIGHLALEPDAFLRDRTLALGHLPVALIIEPPQGFANQTLASYLSRYLTVLRRDDEATFLESYFSAHGFTVRTADYVVAMYETARCFDVYRRWGDRPALFKLSASDRRFTKDALERLGIPRDAWFVCVHARDGGFSPSDESWHSHRNVAIEDFGPAMDVITARGGWCVRVGDPTMPPMTPRARCIDYATSDLKSARLDIGLAASCRFFLGCASGLYNVAVMFGRPSALANVSPLSGAYSQGVADLSIPQRLADLDGRVLPFEEIFATDVANFRFAEEFASRGLKPQNVSPSAISDMAEEMCDRLDGTARYSTDDELRQIAFKSFLRPGHYAYGTGSRIARDYLRSNLTLPGERETVSAIGSSR